MASQISVCVVAGGPPKDGSWGSYSLCVFSNTPLAVLGPQGLSVLCVYTCVYPLCESQAWAELCRNLHALLGEWRKRYGDTGDLHQSVRTFFKLNEILICSVLFILPANCVIELCSNSHRLLALSDA